MVATGYIKVGMVGQALKEQGQLDPAAMRLGALDLINCLDHV